MLGFWSVLVKPEPEGPVQDQVTGIVLAVVADKFKVESVHIGEFAVITGVIGVWLTTAVVVPAADTQLLMVTVTL